MRCRGSKRSGIARAVSTVFVACVAANLGISQAHAALQHAAPSPTELKPIASDPEPSIKDGGEDYGKKKEKNGISGASAEPQRIVVVVSEKNPLESLRMDELRRIFLRKKTQWKNGSSITVYDRSVDHEIRHEFSERILQKKPSELREYWMNLQLTRGLRPPKVLRSAKLVKRYLQRVRGGIGYLYESEVDDTVKVIEIKGRQRG